MPDAFKYETEQDLAEFEERFNTRFDMARLVLERKYRWARYTLRNLRPKMVPSATMAVDDYMTLYYGFITDEWSDKAFVGALWHECNHLLRRHSERLNDLRESLDLSHQYANVAADCEINDDLRDQGIELPEGILYSEDERVNHEPHITAEEHLTLFKQEQPPPQEGGGGEGEDGEGDEEGEGQGQAPGNPSCGSGSGGDPIEGEEEADEAQKDAADRAQRKQDQEIADEVEQNGGLLPGMSQEMHDAAVERIGKAVHDWRRTLSTELRNAMEQKADEAEEYTFRRRSRRAEAVGDDFILPGSYRPIPNLHVVVDVSGSMDRLKLEAAMRQVHGVLERLAIPSFTVYAWNTQHASTTLVQTPADVDKVFRQTGGGTDMQAGVNHAMTQGAEVIIVMTDNETAWDSNGPFGIPVILCGIRRRGGNEVPKWTRLVDVEDDDEQHARARRA